MLDLTPLLTADLAVQIHAFAALEAVVLTPFVLFRKRRDWVHRITGYIWVTNMLITALSSFWITEIRLIGPFSPIHALSVLTLVNLVLAIRAIRQKNLRLHQAIMRNTAFWALGVAGAFTLLPGRIMHAVVFGPEPLDGRNFAALAAITMFVLAASWIAWRLVRGRQVSAA